MPVTPHAALPNASLTDRELQVFAYQATALTPTMISQELGMSPKILQHHLSAIDRKFTTGPQGAASDSCADDSCWPFS